MKTRTIVCLTVAAVGYGAFLHAAKARGQAEPVAPTALPMSIPLGHRHDGPADSCDDLRIRLHDERPEMQEEERSVSKGEARVLRVHPMRNSGAQVMGWDKDTYSVTACKAVIGSDAQRLLSQIKLKVEGGEVSVEGPSRNGDDWTVYLLVRTPKSADVELTTHNGPASFYSVDGKITARAGNGPISLENCSGEADRNRHSRWT